MKDFVVYIKGNVSAQISIIAIIACFFYPPTPGNYQMFSFVRFGVFVSCIICAIDLLCSNIKDKILVACYLAMAVYYQPLYKFFDFWITIGKHVNFNYADVYIPIRFGWALLALLVVTYLEKKYRRNQWAKNITREFYSA